VTPVSFFSFRAPFFLRFALLGRAMTQAGVRKRLRLACAISENQREGELEIASAFKPLSHMRQRMKKSFDSA